MVKDKNGGHIKKNDWSPIWYLVHAKRVDPYLDMLKAFEQQDGLLPNYNHKNH